MESLSEFGDRLADLIDQLRQCERMAGELWGGTCGRAADPDFGLPAIPDDPGWPAMGRMFDALATARSMIEDARTAEIVEAIEGQRKADDEDEARADAASY